MVDCGRRHHRSIVFVEISHIKGQRTCVSCDIVAGAGTLGIMI